MFRLRLLLLKLMIVMKDESHCNYDADVCVVLMKSGGPLPFGFVENEQS